MEVKNDFPNVDKVLRKLRELYQDAKKMYETSNDEDEKDDGKMVMDQINKFIEAISGYLDSVCNTDRRVAKKREEAKDREELMTFISDEDDKRTRFHNEIIQNMVMIDRLAKFLGKDVVFNYAGKFQDEFSELIANSPEEKKKMSTDARIKRREMGNFGLYIAASVTAGLELDDKDVRKFASCETEKGEVDTITYNDIADKSGRVKSNMGKVLE